MTASPHADLAYLSLTELARRLTSREISAVALTEAFYARIEALDGRLKSYQRLMVDSALAEAGAADAAFARGEVKGPLQGIPVAVKDLCDTAGVVTAGGMAWYADRTPTQDCTVVARLRDAGAVVLGKLTMTQGAMSQHRLTPPPLNPWTAGDAPMWAGSSSSGSGVAAAAGLCVASIGSDTGGSIRFPALCNGVSGIKPTWGRVSRAGVLPLASSLDHVGPLSRGIDASAAVLQAIAGYDSADTTSLSAPVPDFFASLGQGIEGLTIGYDPKFCTEGVHAEVVAGVEGAIETLKGLGAQLREIRLPPGDVGTDWIAICSPETALAHAQTYDANRETYGSALSLLIEEGRRMSAEDCADANLRRLAYRGAVLHLFRDLDLIIMPLMAEPTPEASAFEDAEPSLELFAGFLTFSAPAPLTGSPALQLPCGFDSRGLPQGFQLMAAPKQEETLFRAGGAWQQATDWHEKRPI
ncbi:MAG: amidase [Kiloniellales bacterium]